MKKIIFLFALAGFFYDGQAQGKLLKLLQTNGDSIGLNSNDVWKVVAAGTGSTAFVGQKAYNLSTSFDDFLALAGGEFKEFDYFVAGGSTRTFALNQSAISRAYKVGGNSKVWIKGLQSPIDLDAGFHVLFGASITGVKEFTSFDTIGYVVPSGAKALQIVLVGAGGGGGSGRRGPAGEARSGGSGGGAGAYVEATIEVAAFSLDTLVIRIGKGGAGGAAVTANATDGNAGSAGVASSILHGSTVILTASGGSAGAAGTTSGSTGGAGGTTGDYAGAAGGAGANTGTGANGSSATTKAPGGGGGGGGISSGNSAGPGGSGGNGFYGLSSGGAADADATGPTLGRITGGGGGGGTAQAAAAGGAGQDGVAGGGGGGGAGSLNGNNSGAGGAGGDGYVRIIPIF